MVIFILNWKIRIKACPLSLAKPSVITFALAHQYIVSPVFVVKNVKAFTTHNSCLSSGLYWLWSQALHTHTHTNKILSLCSCYICTQRVCVCMYFSLSVFVSNSRIRWKPENSFVGLACAAPSFFLYFVYIFFLFIFSAGSVIQVGGQITCFFFFSRE